MPDKILRFALLPTLYAVALLSPVAAATAQEPGEAARRAREGAAERARDAQRRDVERKNVEMVAQRQRAQDTFYAQQKANATTPDALRQSLPVRNMGREHLGNLPAPVTPRGPRPPASGPGRGRAPGS